MTQQPSITPVVTEVRLGTFADAVRQYGQPSEGAGTPEVGHAVRYLSEQHLARCSEITNEVSARGADRLTAGEQRRFDTHDREAGLLAQLAERYEARSDNRIRIARELGTTGNEDRVSGFHIGGVPAYRRGDSHGPSWIADMAAVGLMRGDVSGASERLQRNTREVQVETRALSTTDGAGGDFVPPLWMVKDYVELARAARVTANLVRNTQLPAGTDSLNVPKVVTGTAVAEQAVQNTAVQATDATTGTVTAAVATIAGQQVIPLQLIEQSPVSTDQMILGDLLADLASKVDLFVLNNNATNKKGLLQEAGTNAVTFTSASPTVALFYSKLADAVRQVLVGRFQSPTAILMSPMRWAWLLAASDSNGRPLVTPDAGGPMNSLGQTSGLTDPATGRVGIMLGLPVYVDPLIPSNLGAGTNEDRVIVAKLDDSVLYESQVKAEAFREPLAGQLSVLLRVYEYVAFTAARYPKSTSVIAGTGLVQPTL